MSPTATTNITTKCTPNTQTPSRHTAYDSQLHPSQPPPPSPQTPPSADHTSSHSPAQGLAHPKQDVSTGRPTKRQRRTTRSASMAAERASSSSDSSSQSGMADHDTEPERIHPPSDRRAGAPQAAAPPKKKRTRTLTTPHQSAVLHALLAKSRFPTTAAREEVGRQIGLSARKVQIWFQNQRQKARRPQSDSAPLTRPPQFGPFPIMTPGPSSSSYPSPSATAPASEKPHSGHSSTRSAVRESGGSLDSNPALSGPGMPGQPPSSHGPPSADEWESPRGVPPSPPTLGHSQHPFPPRPFDAPKLGGSRAMMLPPFGQATPPIDSSPHFSRVLPPIQLGTLRPRSHTEPHASAVPSPLPLPPVSAPAAPRTSVTVVRRHDMPPPRSGSTSPSALSIPPPFALQPKPQWDPHTFAPYTRPEFASWTSSGRNSLSHDHTMRHVSPDGSRRRFMSPGAPPDHPLSSPSRGHHRHSTSCRAAGPGHYHVRPNDEA